MIRFKKSFFDPYYKESFYKDLAHKTLGSAIAHLFVACLFGAFIASMGFYITQKDRVETFLLSVIDTVSNEYPYNYRVGIENGELVSNISPMYFFDTKTSGKMMPKGLYPDKLIAIDSNANIDGADVRNYNAHYIFLKNGYIKTLAGVTENYKGAKDFMLTRSNLEILLVKVRTLVPLFSRLAFMYFPAVYLLKSFIIAGVLYLLFNRYFKEKITFKSAYILSTFAGGTVLIIELLFITIHMPIFPFFEIIAAILFILLMHRNASYFPKVTLKRKKAHHK
jgi:hypothetical protein